jgi:hypothetical protein
MMRCIWVGEQRRREERRARESQVALLPPESEDVVDDELTSTLNEQRLLSEVERREELELEAMLEMLDVDPDERIEPPNSWTPSMDDHSRYGSDDEDYDKIFERVFDQQAQNEQLHGVRGEQMMDTS